MDTGARIDSAIPMAVPGPRWQAPPDGDGASALLVRSNLLGADLALTNFGGGNTSAKLDATDPLTGERVRVLWVKGSGGDLGSMGLDGFATLRLDRLLSLERLYRGPEHEDEMVGLYPHCVFGLNPRPPSIDTPLHAFLPFAHVDHVHPDAVIALACAREGARAVEAIYGGTVGWLDWRRPGFALALALRDMVVARPGLRGVVLGGHGLICWGETAEACYANTLDLVATAAHAVNARLAAAPAFGGRVLADVPASRAQLARLVSGLRDALDPALHKLAHLDRSPETLEFVASADAERLAAIGTSCPDHFLRTKIRPLLVDAETAGDSARLREAIAGYRRAYEAYHARCRRADSPAVRDPDPVIILVRGIGMVAFATDRTTARIASEFYRNAINVMRGAEAFGGYVGLPEQEAFDIEYWALEEAKLRRMPAPRPLQGRVALVTGGAGGIGRATANRLAELGACITLTDIDADALERAHGALVARFGADRVTAVVMDATREEDVEAANQHAALTFGGLDILVANAGIASSAPIEDTTLALWRRNYDVLADGYFLAARAAFGLMKGRGGSIVFVGSKNALAATPNASAYASAKAAALHLARCLALEGAPFGIRVNVVNPDAVIRGSAIWNGDWREERARAYGIDPGDELEAFYRNRSLLKADVLPEDVAEAIAFFAGDASLKSTGNVLNVDAGNAQSFVR